MATILLSTKQVADVLGVTEQTVLNYVSAGRLPAKRLSARTMRYRADSVARFSGMDVKDVVAKAFGCTPDTMGANAT